VPVGSRSGTARSVKKCFQSMSAQSCAGDSVE
jgi:hypothetical protein